MDIKINTNTNWYETFIFLKGRHKTQGEEEGKKIHWNSTTVPSC
jgi:hypothetical protein